MTYPPAWPWMAALDRENLEYLHADLGEVAAEPDLGKAMHELNRLAHEWAATVQASTDELAQEQAERLVDAQGAPHFGCCPDHDWRGPGRDTSAEACADLAQHEAETHDKESDRG